LISTAPHLQKLSADGVISVASDGTVRLTSKAWRACVSSTEYAEPALHFVRFKDDRWHNAVKTFGKPDFIHRFWDYRAFCEVVPGDTVIFAEGDEHQNIVPFAFDDSANF
jgi:hypothetical protein